jgi:hypothetical protein
MHGARRLFGGTIRGTSSFRSLRGSAILHLFNELENIFGLREQPVQPPSAIQLLMVEPGRHRLRGANGFLRLFGETIDIHMELTSDTSAK